MLPYWPIFVNMRLAADYWPLISFPFSSDISGRAVDKLLIVPIFRSTALDLFRFIDRSSDARQPFIGRQSRAREVASALYRGPKSPGARKPDTMSGSVLVSIIFYWLSLHFDAPMPAYFGRTAVATEFQPLFSHEILRKFSEWFTDSTLFYL